jgi:predicted DsbA family dithiol-disulfide isomerase
VNVEIWSDIACPWCYVGKRRFEAALENFEHRDEVNVTWRSFELDPGAPAEVEGERAAALAAKYGVSVQRAREMEQSMTDTAAADGLEFRFDQARSGNTFDAHRLVHLAETHGKQDAMKERLFAAYLSEGELVSDHQTLRKLATDIGLPEDEVIDTLAGDRFADDVRGDERTGSQLGITGVPFFVIDRAMGASGAQPAEVLLDFLQQGWDARPPLAVVADGATCGPDGC